jgi:hypothetical protein
VCASLRRDAAQAVVQPPTLGQRLFSFGGGGGSESAGADDDDDNNASATAAALPKQPKRDVFRTSLPGADPSLLDVLRDKGVPIAAAAVGDERMQDMARKHTQNTNNP